MKNKLILSVLGLSLALVLPSCSKQGTSTSTKTITMTYGIHEDVEFGGVCLETSIEDFMKCGFKFGDSCDISFSNGVSFQDIPYYDGYYVKTGDLLIVGYPGYEFVEFTIGNTSGFYGSFNFPENTTATVTLKEVGKYKTTQDALSVTYTDERSNYASDEIFANYRNVKYGRIGTNVLYRGASPVNNVHKRAGFVDDFLEKDGIKYIIDISDTQANMTNYFADPSFSSTYAKSLYDAGKINMLGLDMGYTSDAYGQVVASACKSMLQNEGPYYFHCTEGKDRTGFFAVMLEALMGATNEELEEDYMITYDNYYGVNKTDTPETYEAIVTLRFDAFVEFFDKETDEKTTTLETKIDHYLTRSGMTNSELQQFKTLLATNIA